MQFIEAEAGRGSVNTLFLKVSDPSLGKCSPEGEQDPFPSIWQSVRLEARKQKCIRALTLEQISNVTEHLTTALTISLLKYIQNHTLVDLRSSSFPSLRQGSVHAHCVHRLVGS